MTTEPEGPTQLPFPAEVFTDEGTQYFTALLADGLDVARFAARDRQQAIRANADRAEAIADRDAMLPRANGAARELADLRDDVATSRDEAEKAREMYGFAAHDRDVMSLRIDDLTAERDALQARLDAVDAMWLQCRQDYGRLVHAIGCIEDDPADEVLEAANRLWEENRDKQRRLDAGVKAFEEFDSLAYADAVIAERIRSALKGETQ